MSYSKIITILFALLLHLQPASSQVYNPETESGVRFQFIAGSNFMQPLKFQGTTDIKGTLNPGLQIGIGIMHDVNQRNAFSYQFQYNMLRHGSQHSIMFGPNSYVNTRYGVSEIDDNFPLFDSFSTGPETAGYQLTVNWIRKHQFRRHTLGPILGLNLNYLFDNLSVLTSGISEDFNNRETYYQYLKTVVLNNEPIYKLGLNLGLHYRYETKRSNAFFADLTLHLYTNHDVDQAEWAIRGKHPDPYQTDRGTIKYSYNRMSLTFGYAF